MDLLQQVFGFSDSGQRTFLEEGGCPGRVVETGVWIQEQQREVEHGGAVLRVRCAPEQLEGLGDVLFHTEPVVIQVAQVALGGGVTQRHRLSVVTDGPRQVQRYTLAVLVQPCEIAERGRIAQALRLHEKLPRLLVIAANLEALVFDAA